MRLNPAPVKEEFAFPLSGAWGEFFKRVGERAAKVWGFGPTAERPADQREEGDTFFDTTLGYPLWWDGDAWSSAFGILPGDTSVFLNGSGEFSAPNGRGTTHANKVDLSAGTLALVDFAIPPGVKRITVGAWGLSTNGVSNPMIQIGPLSGPELVGYTAGAGNRAADNPQTNGFTTNTATAAASLYNVIVDLILVDPVSNTWMASGHSHVTIGATVNSIVGSKTISGGELRVVRWSTETGVDLYDAGFVNVSWQF